MAIIDSVTPTRRSHDLLFLAPLLVLFLGAACAEAIVAPLGAAILRHVWASNALTHATASELVHGLGLIAIAKALPLHLSCKLFGGSALAIRSPLLLFSTLVLIAFWMLLRRRFAELPSLAACCTMFAVAGIEPLAVALPVRGLILVVVGGLSGVVVALVLRRLPLRWQAGVVTLCFFAWMGRCAFEGVGEVHQRHALAVLERTVDRTAAPGEAIIVTDPILAPPLWFYGSDEVRQQMRFATVPGRHHKMSSTRLMQLAGIGELPFPATASLPPPDPSTERIVLAEPPNASAETIVLSEHVPWDRFSNFVSPLSMPPTRILIETSSVPPADVSSKP